MQSDLELKCSPFITHFIITLICMYGNMVMLLLPIFFIMEFYKVFVEKWLWIFL